MKLNKQLILNLIVYSCAIHFIFSLIVIEAVPKKAMLDSAWEVFAFFPQVSLMYSFPPTDPFHNGVVNYWKVVGKLADAFPGSLLYGMIITLLLELVRSNHCTRDAK